MTRKYEKRLFSQMWIADLHDIANGTIDQVISDIKKMKTKYGAEGYFNLHIKWNDDDGDANCYSVYGDYLETDEELQIRKDADAAAEKDIRKYQQTSKERTIKNAAKLLRTNGYSVTKKKT